MSDVTSADRTLVERRGTPLTRALMTARKEQNCYLLVVADHAFRLVFQLLVLSLQEL